MLSSAAPPSLAPVCTVGAGMGIEPSPRRTIWQGRWKILTPVGASPRMLAAKVRRSQRLGCALTQRLGRGESDADEKRSDDLRWLFRAPCARVALATHSAPLELSVSEREAWRSK